MTTLVASSSSNHGFDLENPECRISDNQFDKIFEGHNVVR